MWVVEQLHLIEILWNTKKNEVNLNQELIKISDFSWLKLCSSDKRFINKGFLI